MGNFEVHYMALQCTERIHEGTEKSGRRLAGGNWITESQEPNFEFSKAVYISREIESNVHVNSGMMINVVRRIRWFWF
jgi:hypothetical protein